MTNGIGVAFDKALRKKRLDLVMSILRFVVQCSYVIKSLKNKYHSRAFYLPGNLFALCFGYFLGLLLSLPLPYKLQHLMPVI